MGSTAGLYPFPFYSAYNSSKAALVHYGSTLKLEMEPFGVDVISVGSSADLPRCTST